MKGQTFYLGISASLCIFWFMRKARAFITDGGGTRHLHVVSRIVNRDFVLGVEEKEFFRKTMRKLETFSGIQILTYCLMNNHFHLLIKVPENSDLSDGDLCQRMGALYSKLNVSEFKEKLLKARREGDSALAQLLRKKSPAVCAIFPCS